MKKRIIIISCVIAINAIAFTNLRSAPNAPPEGPVRKYMYFQCDCDTGEKIPGDCRFADCTMYGTEEECQDGLDCFDPNPPPQP